MVKDVNLRDTFEKCFIQFEDIDPHQFQVITNSKIEVNLKRLKEEDDQKKQKKKY